MMCSFHGQALSENYSESVGADLPVGMESDYI